MGGAEIYINGDKLTKVVIPEGVTQIRDYAFYNAEIENVQIHGGVSIIGKYAFGNTSLNNVYIGEGVDVIDDYAFTSSNLKKISVPNSVVSIGEGAFYSSNLHEITLPFVGSGRGGSGNYDDVLCYIFGKSTTSWPSASNIGQKYGNYICYYNKPINLNKVTITDETELPVGAFYNCSFLEEVVINGGVNHIGENALFGCTELKYIYLGEALFSLSDIAFNELTSLEKISTSPENTAYCTDASDVLYTKDMKTLVAYPQARPWPYYNIAEGTTTVNANAFYNCTNLFSILIPESVTSISGGIVNCPNATLYVYNGTAGHTFAEQSGMNYVVVDDQNLVAIEVFNLPTTTEFVRGLEYDFDGLYIVGYYDSGMITEITDYELIYDKNKLGTQMVTVKSGEFTTEFEISVRDRVVTAIEAELPDENSTFVVGSEFKIDNLKVSLIYEDGGKFEITDYSVSVPDMSTVGTKVVTVTYGDFTDTFEITVRDKEATGINISTPADKLNYVIGEELSTEGIVVQLIYDNGTFDDVTDECTYSGFDSSSIGTKNIAVAYGEFTVEYSIVISKKSGEKAPVPVVKYRDNSKIELVAVSGCEYSINGSTWQSSPVFASLDSNTEYTFYQRYTETDTSEVGEASDALIVNTKYPVYGYIGIKGAFIAGGTIIADITTMLPPDASVKYQWLRDGNEITGATHSSYILTTNDLACKISVRVEATDDYFGVLTSKARIVSPTAPKIQSVTATSVTLQHEDGFEYSNTSGASWQSSNTFEDLTPGTSYLFCRRAIETDECFASDSSAETGATTLKRFSYVFYSENKETVIISGEATENDDVVAPNAPVKPDEGNESYTFIGWDIDGDGNADKLPEKYVSDLTAIALYSSECSHTNCTWKYISFDKQEFICDSCGKTTETKDCNLTEKMDVDGDNKVGTTDITIIEKAISGIKMLDYDLKSVDFDNDGKITMYDLNRYMALLRDVLDDTQNA